MISFIFLAFPTLILILSLIKLLRNPGSHVMKKLPPGPRGLPLIGNLHQLGNLPHISLQQLSTQHGPLMFLRLGSIPTLVISSAEMARQIFKIHDEVFSGRPKLYAGEQIGYKGSSLALSPYGEYWKDVRKIMVSELLSVKRVLSFHDVRSEEVELAVNKLALACGPVNLSELTLLIANNVVCRVALGTRYEGGSGSGFCEMLRVTQELLGGFCLADFFPGLEWVNKLTGLQTRLGKNFKEMDVFYDKVIEDHRRDSSQRVGVQNEDLVHVLLRLQKDQTRPTALSDRQIKGVLNDIFVAGTDTAAATMLWTLTELIKNPKCMRRAQEEVRELVGDNKKVKVEERDLAMLPYLKSVVKESLRLHPPAPLLLPRETTRSCHVSGYYIPPKTRVFVNAKSIATDPNRWENPHEFSPERFLGGVGFFEMLPFGAGRRVCPGVNFAMPLIELVLANLLLRFDWELPRGVGRDDVDMEEAFGITMHKKHPLCLIPIPYRFHK